MVKWQKVGPWFPRSYATATPFFARIVDAAMLVTGAAENRLPSCASPPHDFANFKSDEYGPDVTVKQQSESARLKGIEHFRAALESLPDGPVGREAWTKAMRLLLRRSGEQPEYVCFEG
jgi:hypothetical protein